MPSPDDPTWARLEDQLKWYGSKSVEAQRAHKRLKLIELVAAASLPVAAGVGAAPLLTGAIGALVVVLEGVEHLYQFQTNWILYRSTAEALKHERYLYLAQAGPYTSQQRTRILAERIEGLVSQEHAKWTQGRDQDGHHPSDGDARRMADESGQRDPLADGGRSS